MQLPYQQCHCNGNGLELFSKGIAPGNRNKRFLFLVGIGTGGSEAFCGQLFLGANRRLERSLLFPSVYFPRVGVDDPEEPDDEWGSWDIEREEFNEKADKQSGEETAANDESLGVDEDEM